MVCPFLLERQDLLKNDEGPRCLEGMGLLGVYYYSLWRALSKSLALCVSSAVRVSPPHSQLELGFVRSSIEGGPFRW